MENERVLIATDSQTLKAVLTEIFKPESQVNVSPDFEIDKISKVKAAKMIGISIPTLDSQIKAGKFKQYSIGRKKYFLKSELQRALTNSNL